MQSRISVEDVTKVYRTRGKEIVAVNKLGFEVREGEIYGLLGPNGAGKTTTIKMMCGLVYPTAGKIFVDGHNSITDMSKVHQRVGVVLEGNRNLHWRLTVRENLEYFANLHFVSGRKLKERIEQLLDFLQLKEKGNIMVMTLSRGMQQKVAIGIAMIADAPVLLLDEPTIGLDVESARALKSRIKDISKKLGKSVLLTTHQMNIAEELCDRIGILRQGKLIREDKPDRLIDVFSSGYYKLVLAKRHLNSIQKEKLERIAGVRIEELKQGNGENEEFLSVTIDSENAVYKVLRILETAQTPIVSLGKERPSLEDVFVQIVQGGEKR